MPNIFLKVKAWQLSWLRRAYLNPNANWVKVVNSLLTNIRIKDLLSCQVTDLTCILSLPSFYQNILKTWFNLRKSFIDDTNLLNESLWFNDKITVENKPLFWIKWYNNGVKQIRDLTKLDGSFYNLE